MEAGNSPDVNDNPMTVFIAVDYESDETEWPSVVEEIEKYLAEFADGLAVQIEHGRCYLYGMFID